MFSKQSVALLLVSLVGFIDVMGVGLVYPMFASMLYQGDCHILPEQVSDSMRGVCLGILLAMMPLTQFFSAPILGALSDIKGRKRIILPSLLASIFGYSLAMLAVNIESFFLLLLSRVFVGISAGSAAVVSASVADLSSNEDKAKNFGLFNMACGLGFTAGPFIGGVLSGVVIYGLSGYSLPFAVAGTVTLINWILVLAFYDDIYTPKVANSLNLSLGVRNIVKGFKIPGLKTLLFCVFSACVGWSFYWEFAPVTWIATYQFSTAEIGNFYAYGAFVYALSCGVLIRPIVNRFSNQMVLVFALLLCGLSIGSMWFYTSQIWLWVCIPIQQFAIALFWPTSAALVSNSVGEDMQGEIMGIFQSVDSLAFALSPLVAGSLLGISHLMPIYVGMLCMFIAASTLTAYVQEKRKILTQEIGV